MTTWYTAFSKSTNTKVPLYDWVESVMALVGWLTRAKEYVRTLSLLINIRFKINDGNWRDLIHLSDKYYIESLRKDIQVFDISPYMIID